MPEPIWRLRRLHDYNFVLRASIDEQIANIVTVNQCKKIETGTCDEFNDLQDGGLWFQSSIRLAYWQVPYPELLQDDFLLCF